MMVCHNNDGSVMGFPKNMTFQKLVLFQSSYREYEEISKCSHSHSLYLSLTEYKCLYTLSK